MSATATDRRLRARIAAYAMHAQHSAKETTTNARRTFQDSFLAGIDPSLPETERQRRAKSARKAFYTRLALASVQARRAKKGQVQA